MITTLHDKSEPLFAKRKTKTTTTPLNGNEQPQEMSNSNNFKFQAVLPFSITWEEHTLSKSNNEKKEFCAEENIGF